jgi:hypothetical protein
MGDDKQNKDMTGLTKFVELTVRALEEEDPDKFVEILTERAEFLGELIKSGYEMDSEDVAACLERESLIVERLERERSQLLKGMEMLWKSMQAVRAYTPKFALPSMPIFFDKKG